MSTATELLKEIYADLEYDSKLPLWLRDKVRAFLAAEPEAEPVADDLLVKMFKALEAGVSISPNSVFHDLIKKHLSAPKINPIGWVNKERNLLSWDKLYEDMEPLYTRPEPATRKPLTEDAEDEAFNSASKYAAWLETENRMLRESRKPITKREMLTWYDELRPKSVADFVLGVRFAERYHGIGGDDD